MKKSVEKRLEGLTPEQIAARKSQIDEAEAYLKRLKHEQSNMPPEATAFDIDVVKRLVADARAKVRELKTRKNWPAALSTQ